MINYYSYNIDGNKYICSIPDERNSRGAKQQQRQGRKMEPVQLTNDLQKLVDQNIISKEQAKNMMKDNQNANNNTYSLFIQR